jgi:hypothetical protein
MFTFPLLLTFVVVVVVVVVVLHPLRYIYSHLVGLLDGYWECIAMLMFGGVEPPWRGVGDNISMALPSMAEIQP